jgi:hypothetical protein
MTSAIDKSSGRAQLVLALCGLGLVTIFVARVGVSAVLRQLAQLGPGATLILVPYALGTSIGALPWARLLPEAERPSLLGTIASRFAASGANALLPVFGLAGEPSRLLWLPSEARARGVAAIVLDRVLYNGASALLLLLSAVVSLTTRLSGTLRAALALIAAATLLVTFGGAWFVARAGVGERLSRLLRKRLGSAYGEHQFGAEVDAAVQRTLKRERETLASGLLLHFLGRGVQAAETYVVLRSLHTQSTLAEALVLATAPIASAFFASSIPSQLGVQEGVLMFTCQALGLSPALGLTLALLTRLRQLVFVPFTPLLLAFAKPGPQVCVSSHRANT